MTSETAICNLALARVGQSQIVNIDDGDRLSRICKLLYAPKRDTLLRSYRWKFAISRANMSPLAVAPAFGYTKAYSMPNGCLRVLSVNELDPEYDLDLYPEQWDVEGDTIVTDLAAPIKVKFIKRITDTSLFDASFEDALSSYLALFIAPSLRETEEKIIATLRQEFELVVQNARYINAIEGRPKKRVMTRSKWIHGNRIA